MEVISTTSMAKSTTIMEVVNTDVGWIMSVKIPENMDLAIQNHKKWLEMVKGAQKVITEDKDLQYKAENKGLRIKERAMPPLVLGRIYVQYCNLINRMYQAYLNCVQIQRASYIKGIIGVFIKRLYELRNELVHLILNDYIYVDASLAQMSLTPADIEIVVPYHFAIEAREGSIEELLQTMWAEAVKRKNAPPPPPPKVKETLGTDDEDFDFGPEEVSQKESLVIAVKESEHSIIPEEYIQATIIQKMERYRKYYMADFRAKNIKRRMYFASKAKRPRKMLSAAAARVIQMVYRRYMEIKREHVRRYRADVKLGMVPDAWKPRMNYDEENRKLYELRRRVNERTKEKYLEEFEKQKARLYLLKKDDQMEDISEEIREWFMEWYFGYKFFPQYPYALEGGTILVIRGDFPTVDEQIVEDERIAAATKGKTKEMLKLEKEREKEDAEMKAELLRENQKKEALAEFKAKCNPLGDMGYKVKKSAHMDKIALAFEDYMASWSIYDRFSPEHFGEIVYGFMRPLITEEIMSQLHQDCRMIVDDLMRLELKLLITAQKKMYKQEGKKFPKIKPRPRPPMPPPPKTFTMDSDMLKKIEGVFDLGIISKPTNKIKDIIGDSNYAAYDLNIEDPYAKFPPPGYGDVRQRLILTCVFGSGVEPSAPRKKAVMLLGSPKNGKSFLVDCVAGELNAVKFDISPEVFSAIASKPQRLLTQVFTAARIFQPSVIYLRNVERVFMKKLPPEDKRLKPKAIKKALVKLVKGLQADDKVIFIATCSNPFGFPARSMVAFFDEIILVPRTDYNTVQQFFYYKLQSIRSMPRDYCVQPLAQLLQGYGFGVIMEVYEKIMTPERIVRLNANPLMPIEFLQYLLLAEIEPVTLEDYDEYVQFYIKNSSLRKGRAEYEIINASRASAYIKIEKKKAAEATKAKEGG